MSCLHLTKTFDSISHFNSLSYTALVYICQNFRDILTRLLGERVPNLDITSESDTPIPSTPFSTFSIPWTSNLIPQGGKSVVRLLWTFARGFLYKRKKIFRKMRTCQGEFRLKWFAVVVVGGILEAVKECPHLGGRKCPWTFVVVQILLFLYTERIWTFKEAIFTDHSRKYCQVLLYETGGVLCCEIA